MLRHGRPQVARPMCDDELSMGIRRHKGPRVPKGVFPLALIHIKKVSLKAKTWAISRDTHQLHYIPKHHFII